MTHNRAVRWLAPDLALSLAVVTLLYCLTIFEGGHKLFRDSDTGWHIRTGERILADGGLPRTDPYSFSKAAHPWFAWEWGADAIMGAAHLAGGLQCVALLYALAIAACTWLWVKLQWAVGGSFLLVCLFAAPMLSTANLHWLARPHVFGWLLLLAWMLLLERGRVHPAIALAIGAIWANLHASFFLAPLIAVLYGRRAVLAAVLSLAGSFLNPYGGNLHAHIARYLGDWELLSRVGEFQSFNFHVPGAWQIIAAMAIAALGASAALLEGRLAHVLISGFFLVGALRSARGLPLVALIALPLANGAIAAALRRASNLAPRIREALDRSLAYGGRLRLLDRGLNGALLVPFVAVLAWVILQRTGAGFPPDQFPVEAATVVEQLPADAVLLAPDKFGGYLIYRFDGRRKVFFDGRSDFYGSAFMKSYIRLIEVRPGWHDLMAHYRFTHALLPPDYSLRGALADRGWRAIYQDSTAILLARPGP